MIAASRKFVCIRPSTYESASEARILKRFFIGGSGDLENTTFALVAPDGQTALSRASRTPRQVYRSAADMAAAMDRIAARYPERDAERALPVQPDLRLALNVAAADQRPLVVAAAATESRRREMVERLAGIAWDEAYAGRLIHVSQVGSRGLEAAGARGKTGYVVVAPGRFGTDGEVLEILPADAGAEALREALDRALAKVRRTSRDIRSHVEAGRRQGVAWETEIPVTDPGSLHGGPPRRR